VGGLTITPSTQARFTATRIFNYVVDVDGFILVVPESNAPSNDECSAIYFDPKALGRPAVFCFETPLGF
jgi:hypothetical protein